MPQKLGDGEVNSTGTSEPSWLICGGRTTLASTLLCALGFSMVIIVPSLRPSGRISMAPLALTVWVFPSSGFDLPATVTVTRILSSTRCARRRSSAVGGRCETTLAGDRAGLAFGCGLITAQAPKNPSPARRVRRRTPIHPVAELRARPPRRHCWSPWQDS